MDPYKEEAKHSRSPTQRKLPWRKWNVKKTQRRGSDKKPSVLETRTVIKELSRKLMWLSLRVQ